MQITCSAISLGCKSSCSRTNPGIGLQPNPFALQARGCGSARLPILRGESIVILQYLRGFPNFFVFKCRKHDIFILKRVDLLKFSLNVPRIGGGVNNPQTFGFACATLWSGVDVRHHFLLAQHAPKACAQTASNLSAVAGFFAALSHAIPRCFFTVSL